MGVELPEFEDRLLECFDGVVGGFGDLGVAVGLDVFEVVVDECAG